MVAASDGSFWLVEASADQNSPQPTNHVDHFTPGGAFMRYSGNSGDIYYDLAAGPAGDVYAVASNGQPGGVIEHFAADGTANRIGNVGDAHGITLGSDGSMWFAEDISHTLNRIGATGVVLSYSVPVARGGPFALTLGPDRNLWFTADGQIGRMTINGAVSLFTIPSGENAAKGITAGPDGNVWFTELSRNKVARVTMAGAVTEFSVPSLPVQSNPESIRGGPDGNVWFTEGGTRKVASISPAGALQEYSAPASPGYYPHSIVKDTAGTLWFATGAQAIWRITMVKDSAPPPAQPRSQTAVPSLSVLPLLSPTPVPSPVPGFGASSLGASASDVGPGATIQLAATFRSEAGVPIAGADVGFRQDGAPVAMSGAQGGLTLDAMAADCRVTFRPQTSPTDSDGIARSSAVLPANCPGRYTLSASLNNLVESVTVSEHAPPALGPDLRLVALAGGVIIGANLGALGWSVRRRRRHAAQGSAAAVDGQKGSASRGVTTKPTIDA
jgi:streptogramin lyase